MPAVLTELGFISNPKDCAVLVSKSGQEQLAKRLFHAFEAYKKSVESSAKSLPAAKTVAQVEKKEEKKVVEKEMKRVEEKVVEKPVGKKTEEFYAVQILSVAKPLPKGAYDLRGHNNAEYIKVGNLYKYYIGRYSSRQEAAGKLPQMRKTFAGAFVIHIKDNNIVK